MKKIVFAAAVVVLALAFATAFADQMPAMTEGRDVGTVEAEAPGYVSESTPAFRGGLLLAPEDVIPTGAGITGKAAGGVSGEDEATRIWDHLMDAPGSLNLE